MTVKTKAQLQKELEELTDSVKFAHEQLTKQQTELAEKEQARINLSYEKESLEQQLDDLLFEQKKTSFELDKLLKKQAEEHSERAAASFESSLFGKLVGMLPNLWSLIPWVLVIAGLVYWYRYQTTTVIDPPTPPDVVTIEKAVGDYFPTQQKEFAKAFSDAATKVRSKEIKTDEQLDALINPQLKAARDLAGKPFDVSFDMSLPRNDDGTFAGKEEDAAKFLEQISRSW